ncbi:MAG: MG2 domain-containing protein [Deltaproteobacteria bacterium]|nr:MG2 domain-containing protein [Deltaproteobacteria bacterium]
MYLRPLAILAALGALSPLQNCSIRSCARGDSANNTDGGAGAVTGPRPTPTPGSIEVRIGTAGDNSLLVPRAHTWQPQRARLVVNAPYQSWSEEGSFVHVVAFTPAMAPCSSSAIYLDNRNIGTTNEHGAFAFKQTPLPRGRGSSFHTLRVACKGAGDLWYAGQHSYSSGTRSSEFSKPIVYVHTDRGVYRPGQTVRVRALAWRLRGEYTAVANAQVRVFLENAQGEPVGGGRFTTDADGVAALDLPLPAHLAEGSYKLIAEMAEYEETSYRPRGRRPNTDATARAEALLQVRQFETPVIELRHTLGEFLTPAMRTVPLTVSLSYMDGAIFTGGTLEILLGPPASQRSVVRREVTGPGPHSVTLSESDLAPLRGSGVARFEFKITDTHGRMDRVVRDLRVVDNPYQATLELDRNGYAVGERVDAALRLTDLNRMIQRNKPVRITGCGQNLSLTTDDTGVAHARFAMPNASCTLEAFVTDASGAVASVSVVRTTQRPMQSRVVETQVRELSPVTIDVEFPGDVLPAERVVHGDITDSSGAMIDSLSIPIVSENGVSRAHTTFRPPSWGSMLVSLYSLGIPRSSSGNRAETGLLTDGQSLAVGAVSHLTMRLHGVGSTPLRPGEIVPVRVEVLRDGQPADAVLGVSVVDRAVISLLDPYEHPPFDRFYDPQLKVLASTGAQTLTWPVVSRTWGDQRHDIGWLPSFGMHGGGSNSSDATFEWPAQFEADPESDPVDSPESSADSIGDTFAFGGMGSGSGSGYGGGGSGEGTIGLGNLGTMGHGSGSADGAGLRAGGGPGRRSRAPSEASNGQGRPMVDDDDDSQEPVLIVRTQTDETSMWLPRERARGGRGEISLRVPDSLGEHQLNVLASDRNGGVALARTTIIARQALHVRADIPQQFTQGDQSTVNVVVRNAEEVATQVTLALRAPGWQVDALGPVSVQVPARGTASARFRVQATQAGIARYIVEAISPALTDRYEGESYVRPRGVVSTERIAGTSTAGTVFSHTISPEVPGCQGPEGACQASARVARLRVSLPDATGLNTALDALDPWVRTRAVRIGRLRCGLTVANGPGVAAVHAHGERTVAEEMFELLPLSHPLTIANAVEWRAHHNLWLAESLAAAAQQGYSVPGGLIAQVIASLERANLSANPVEQWRVTRVLLALKIPARESWRRYQRQSGASLMGEGESTLNALRSAHARLQQGVGSDAESYAEALRLWTLSPFYTTQGAAFSQALFALLGSPAANTSADAGATNHSAAIHQFVSQRAMALLTWRRARVVEPGQSPRDSSALATAVALLALQASDPTRATAEARECAAFLRTNRAGWERWVRPESSALVLQALGSQPLVRETQDTQLIVRVEGREIQRVTVSRDDPWTSLLSLQALELPANATQVTVEYTGNQQAEITLEVDRWATQATRVLAAPGSETRAAQLEISVPERVARGGTVAIAVRAAVGRTVTDAAVLLTLPPFAQLDERAMRTLVSQRALRSYTLRDNLLVLQLNEDSQAVSVSVPLRMPREGRFALVGPELRDASGIIARAPGRELLVE